MMRLIRKLLNFITPNEIKNNENGDKELNSSPIEEDEQRVIDKINELLKGKEVVYLDYPQRLEIANNLGLIDSLEDILEQLMNYKIPNNFMMQRPGMGVIRIMRKGKGASSGKNVSSPVGSINRKEVRSENVKTGRNTSYFLLLTSYYAFYILQPRYLHSGSHKEKWLKQ